MLSSPVHTAVPKKQLYFDQHCEHVSVSVWEQRALFVATAVLSFFAFKTNPFWAIAGFAAGLGLGAHPRKFDLIPCAQSASGGCSGALTVLTQTVRTPWPIAVAVFYLMNKHHLKHHPVYVFSATFGLGVQIAHLLNRKVFRSAG